MSKQDVQVRCTTKISRNNPHEGITHLGGAGWKWTREQVIYAIEMMTHSFFTLVNGRRAEVRVVNGPNGKYLRTVADNTYTDNLLALPECVG